MKNTTEDCVKFWLHELAELTNKFHCNFQSEALVICNKYQFDPFTLLTSISLVTQGNAEMNLQHHTKFPFA